MKSRKKEIKSVEVSDGCDQSEPCRHGIKIIYMDGSQKSKYTDRISIAEKYGNYLFDEYDRKHFRLDKSTPKVMNPALEKSRSTTLRLLSEMSYKLDGTQININNMRNDTIWMVGDTVALVLSGALWSRLNIFLLPIAILAVKDLLGRLESNDKRCRSILTDVVAIKNSMTTVIDISNKMIEEEVNEARIESEMRI